MIAESPTDVASTRPHRKAVSGVVLALTAASAVAWMATTSRMEGMESGPGTDLGALGWFLVTWIVMMAAMMLPSLAPTAIGYSRDARDSPGRGARPPAATAVFVAAYLIPWALFGLFVYALIEGVRSLDVAFLSWSEGGPYVAGGVILAAAAYELTSVKRYCLERCRNPALTAAGERFGYRAAARAGLENGGFCVGCCAGLMAALFAIAVMSVAWMVVFAALIAADKLVPRRRVTVAVAAVLAAFAGAMAFAPDRLPGVTEPGSGDPMHEMEMGATGFEATAFAMSLRAIRSH